MAAIAVGCSSVLMGIGKLDRVSRRK